MESNAFNDEMQNVQTVNRTSTLYFKASKKKQIKLSNACHTTIKWTTGVTFIRILDTEKLA